VQALDSTGTARWTDSIGKRGGTPETIAAAGPKMTLSPFAPCDPSTPADLEDHDPLSGRRHQIQRNGHGGRGRSARLYSV
jgi:hypothetical protein